MAMKTLGAIGLAADAQWPAAALIARLADMASRTVHTPFGIHRICEFEGGGAVWLNHGAAGGPNDGRIQGVNPFHACEGTVRVRVDRMLRLDMADPLSGGYAARLPVHARGDLELPVVLEAIPYLPQRLARVPSEVGLQILALAVEATCYADELTYFASVAKEKLMSAGGIAPAHPAGILHHRQPAPGQLRSFYLVNGLIQEARPLVNPLTRQGYWWMLLQTDRGIVNLAVNARAILGAAPIPGAMVQARARLVCRHAGPAEELEQPGPEISGKQQAASAPLKLRPPGSGDEYC